MWDKMAKGIKKVAKETLEESRGFGLKCKESWWWDPSVKDMTRLNWTILKAWSLCKNIESWEKYNVARKYTNKVVNKASARAYDGLHQSSGT